MKKRCCLWQLTVLLLALLVSGTAAWSSQSSDSDTAAVGTTIPKYVDVEVPDPIYDWGQGVLPNGDPNYALDGEDPFFVGGSVQDFWPSDGPVPLCTGAVGRTTVIVGANCTVEVAIMDALPPLNEWPILSNGEGGVLLGHSLLGWDRGGAEIFPGRERTITINGYDTSTWLYVMAQRKGLDDAAGTYTATIWVDAFAL